MTTTDPDGVAALAKEAYTTYRGTRAEFYAPWDSLSSRTQDAFVFVAKFALVNAALTSGERTDT